MDALVVEAARAGADRAAFQDEALRTLAARFIGEGWGRGLNLATGLQVVCDVRGRGARETRAERAERAARVCGVFARRSCV